ncbi:MAG: peptidase T [Ignavibacteriales bacterium]|nr:MAG: peptidase T [Ignavibacteriaceae bacterium]MBW7873870.1 peptidase T [Ignavibacteria bacterium]MCZ2143371.1 peptidase T [Ignavibacteriales bacterium]MBV6444251.1 Peptidase T [Ignavibacteriaceae bacterium]MBZ0198103.1 peptidase T [Ignavibacteriaceae bacterium]
MFNPDYKFTVVDRFLKYVKIDTQSDDEAPEFPTTQKQLDLSRILVEELLELGLKDAHLDEHGYVYATLPSNSSKEVPVVGFIAHVDTSPAVSGKDVKPIIHKNYEGGDIVLPGDTSKVIDVESNPELKGMIGYDIITTDGTTLLGADDKAGVAAIMDALNYLIQHPEVKHGTIKICFTPDEEVGRGTEHFDVEGFGAKYAYTIDGSSRGEVETETFSADAVVITIYGKNVHPGYAKGKMINSIRVASRFMEMLPKNTLCPETTEGREGYVHCVAFNGMEEKTVLKFIIRDFIDEKLKEFERYLENLLESVVNDYPGARYEFQVQEQYRNMKYVLDQYPEVEANALEALKRLGIPPIQSAIRGGTDGSRLSYMGIPTPNLFAGGHNFHAATEWVAVQDMEMSVRNIVTLANVWEDKA